MFRNDTQYYARFTDANGNILANTKVSFNINCVIYNHTTDANGTAKMNINMAAGDYIVTATNPVTGEAKLNINLMAGKYIITSSYNGFNTANTIKVTD